MEKDPTRSISAYTHEMSFKDKLRFAETAGWKAERIQVFIEKAEEQFVDENYKQVDIPLGNDRDQGTLLITASTLARWRRVVINQLLYVDYIEDEDTQEGDSTGDDYIHYDS